MKKLTPISPYSDSKLYYNETTKQYELTFEFVKAEYDDNFRDDETLKKRIKKNTRTVYNFVKYRINSYNRPIVDIILNKTQQGRDFIFDLLRAQFESDVDSGYNDIGIQAPINTANGQIIPREEIRKNLVSVETEQIFDNSQDYFGLNIGYQGVFPSNYFTIVRTLR